MVQRVRKPKLGTVIAPESDVQRSPAYIAEMLRLDLENIIYAIAQSYKNTGRYTAKMPALQERVREAHVQRHLLSYLLLVSNALASLNPEHAKDWKDTYKELQRVVKGDGDA